MTCRRVIPSARQHPDLAGALDDGHREGVVDQKPADEQRNGAEHIEPHLVAGQHLRDPLALRRGVGHKVFGAEPGLQPRFQICQRGAGRRLGSRDHVHLVDRARSQEKVLRGLQRDHAEGAVVQLARPVFVHQADDFQPGCARRGDKGDFVAETDLLFVGEVLDQHDLVRVLVWRKKTPVEDLVLARVLVDGRIDAVEHYAAGDGAEETEVHLGRQGLVGQDGLAAEHRHKRIDAGRPFDTA